MFIALRAEGATFVKEAQKEGAKAGDAAGKTFGDRLKANAGKLIGGALAAGFAVATKGALEAEAAQGKFMAATGKSREEAKAFVSTMNDLAGTSGAVGKTFEEIADVGTTVEQQFGTTGDATRELTDDILQFSKVTGQDAAGAAAQLEDTLSAFGLEAEDAAGLMDQLVASNQEFGTSAGPDSVKALQDMAPALSAMNLGLDEGIGLLNLFEDAGIPATGAASALNRAVKELKPGQDINDLIAQLSAIEDPTLRAQEAIRIFGKGAGADLALAIEPGMTSLDDFEIAAGDVAGTVETASDDMLILSDRIKGWADKALAGAREVGNQFGPLLTGIGSIGGLAVPLAGKLKDVFASLIAKVLPSATAVGVATGGAQAAAHEAASTGPGVIKSLFARIAAMAIPLAPAGTTVGMAVGGAMSLGMIAGLFAGGVAIHETIGDFFAFPGTKEFVARQGQAAALDYAKGYSDEVRAGAGQIMHDVIRQALEEGKSEQEAALAGEQAVLAYLAAWTNASETAVRVARDMQQRAMHPTAETLAVAGNSGAEVALTWNSGFRAQYESGNAALWQMVKVGVISGVKQTIFGLTDAIRGSKDNVRDAMDDLKWAMLHPLAGAKALARIEGKLTGATLAEGLASQNDGIRSQAEATRAILIAEWEKISGRAYTEGVQGADSLERGLRTFTPVKVSPYALRQGSAGGINPMTGKPWGARASGGPVSADMPYIVGERGPELFIPERRGFIAPNLAGAGSVPSGGGDTYNIPVAVHGLPLRAETPAEVARQMARVATLGELPKRKQWA